MQDTSSIDLDLSAIDHNMAAIRRAVGEGCLLCPIVKADAYGLGVPRVARRLVAAGASMLAVYSLRQAIETAAALGASTPVPTPVLVMMPVRELPREDELVRLMHAGALHLTVHDEANLADLVRAARELGVVLPVHVEVDVGMGRGGSRVEEASRLIRAIADERSLDLHGVFTHFSHARTDAQRTEQQLEAFEFLMRANRNHLPARVLEHVSSTYALARGARYHRSMARFGLAWMGYGLDELVADRAVLAREELLPILRWTSSIVQVRRLPAGTAVGYGARWISGRPSIVGLVPVGYADGYPVAREGGAARFIGVRGPDGARVHAPVVGAVNMDQITVDLTGVVAGDPAAWVGCEAELVSRISGAPNALPELAAASGLIVHELLTRLNPRIPRTASSSRTPVIEVLAGPLAAGEGLRVNAAAG